MQQSMYSPTHPTAGQPGGVTTGLLGALLFVKAPGVRGFSQVLSPGWNHEIFDIENPSDYLSDCYKIKY